MRVWIEQPVEPARLVLAWQAPDGQRDRRRWSVGEIHPTRTAVFRYFTDDELAFHNEGRTDQDLRAAGFAGYPAFPFSLGAAFSDEVLSTFMRRLPPITRSDFGLYQDYFSIPPGTGLSAPILLALTEARLPGDGFSLIDPFDPSVDCCDAPFEVAGFRYEAGDARPPVGSELSLRPDFANVHDDQAVAVFWHEQRIGFVNRLQAPTVRSWLLERDVSCDLLRLNGRVGAPRAYARISVRPRVQTLAA